MSKTMNLAPPSAELESKTARLRLIFRGEEHYGDGTPAQQAARFQREHLLQDVIAAAVARRPKLSRPVDLLVSLSGFSPTTTILAYEVLRPKRLLVISSSSARGGIDEIGAHVVGKGGLNFREFMHQDCDPVDPLSIFRIVRREVEAWQGEKPFHVIDITGGKKVMSATAALAAAQLDLAFCYVDSVFDPEMKQPVPCSEHLVLYGTPTTIFEERELETIKELFNNGAFEEAEKRAEQLCDKMEEPREARLLRHLCGMYLSWRNLDFQSAVARAQPLLAEGITSRFLSGPVLSSVRRQFEVLRRLADGDRSALLLNHFLLGMHYLRLGRHDFAALLFYRTMEGCFSERLKAIGQGFDSSDPNYSLLSSDVEALQRKFIDATALIGEPFATFPRRLGFLDAATLLQALDDALIRRADLSGKSGLGALQTLAQHRNRSVLAHGVDSVTQEKAEELRRGASKLLVEFWKLAFPQERLFPIDPLLFVTLAG